MTVGTEGAGIPQHVSYDLKNLKFKKSNDIGYNYVLNNCGFDIYMNVNFDADQGFVRKVARPCQGTMHVPMAILAIC